jgi:hypothetical protein
VSERVLLSVVEQVGWADVRRQLARHTSAIQGIVRTRNCEFARVFLWNPKSLEHAASDLPKQGLWYAVTHSPQLGMYLASWAVFSR